MSLTIAEVAQVDYTADCCRLDDLARELARVGSALTAARVRHQAAIAYRAGRAEKIDPEPEIRQCSLCRGVQACDIKAHLSWVRA